MSERAELAQADGTGQANGTDSMAAGALLKKSREAAGLHIGALAVALKVPVSKLEALESGNLAQLSGPVFVRALASSVCRTLKIDPAPVLAHLPLPETAHLHQKGDLNEPFRGDGRGVHFSGSERLLKPSVLVVIALLLGSVVLMLLPDLRSAVPSGKEGGPAVASPPVPPPAVDPVATTAPAADPTAVPVVVPVPASPVPVNATMSAGDPAPAGNRMDVPSTSEGPLIFKASGASWVEVTDAKGSVVFRKTLMAGEQAQVGGALPLKVVVGRADLTEVSAHGVRLDLQTLAKDNVARFEVKQ